MTELSVSLVPTVPPRVSFLARCGRWTMRFPVTIRRRMRHRLVLRSLSAEQLRDTGIAPAAAGRHRLAAVRADPNLLGLR